MLYLAGEPVPHAAASVAAAREARAARRLRHQQRLPPPGRGRAPLTALGIPAGAQDVVTSAQAAVRCVAARVPAGSPVLVLGTDGLAEEVAAGGLRPVRSADDAPVAVVQGLSSTPGGGSCPRPRWRVRAGALWVAGNGDRTYPSPRGPLPGNGAFVAALAAATGQQPVVVGKPEPELHHESVQRVAATRPLVVGDRLDTDVLGAVRGGSDSLLVLTGVTGRDELLAAPRGCRPSYVAPDLRGLLAPQPPVHVAGDTATCGSARASAATGGPTGVEDEGGDAEGVEALRAACALAWARADRR